MQVTPLDAALPIAALTGTGPIARVVAGNLTALPVGELVQATITQVGPQQATLTVNGQSVTIRPGTTGFPPGLQTGTVLVVRVPNDNTNSTLELVGRAATGLPVTTGLPNSTALPALPPGIPLPATATGTTGTTGRTTVLPNLTGQTALSLSPGTTGRVATPTPDTAGNVTATPVPTLATPSSTATLRTAMVDVLAVLPDGRVRVRLDGEELAATAQQNLTPGGRYIVQVSRTPTTIALRPLPDTPNLPSVLAGAILRGTNPPNLGASLKPLLQELASLQASTQSKGTAISPAVRDAAVAIRDTIRGFLPSDARAPSPAELRNLVEDGGLHFEAKLARLVAAVAENTNTSGTQSPRSAPDGTATAQTTHTIVGPDLKGDLLRLLQAVQDLGGGVQTPAARTALNGIEAQQATNAVAQANGTPYLLQVPFPDGAEWRTLHLAIDPEGKRPHSDPNEKGSYRLLMHVPLTDLGETWIDAGLTGNRFRAVIYLDKPETRDRVRAELPALQNELVADGFGEVLLDVRSTGDLPAKHRRQVAEMQAGRPDSASILDVRA